MLATPHVQWKRERRQKVLFVVVEIDEERKEEMKYRETSTPLHQREVHVYGGPDT